VVSAVRRAQATHPAGEHLIRWRQRKTPVLVAAQAGIVIARTNGQEMRVTTLKGENLRFENAGKDEASGR